MFDFYCTYLKTCWSSKLVTVPREGPPSDPRQFLFPGSLRPPRFYSFPLPCVSLFLSYCFLYLWVSSLSPFSSGYPWSPCSEVVRVLSEVIRRLQGGNPKLPENSIEFPCICTTSTRRVLPCTFATRLLFYLSLAAQFFLLPSPLCAPFIHSAFCYLFSLLFSSFFERLLFFCNGLIYAFYWSYRDFGSWLWQFRVFVLSNTYIWWVLPMKLHFTGRLWGWFWKLGHGWPNDRFPLSSNLRITLTRRKGSEC